MPEKKPPAPGKIPSGSNQTRLKFGSSFCRGSSSRPLPPFPPDPSSGTDPHGPGEGGCSGQGWGAAGQSPVPTSRSPRRGCRFPPGRGRAQRVRAVAAGPHLPGLPRLHHLHRLELRPGERGTAPRAPGTPGRAQPGGDAGAGALCVPPNPASAAGGIRPRSRGTNQPRSPLHEGNALALNRGRARAASLGAARPHAPNRGGHAVLGASA